jgi:hypothetical protein
MQNFLQWIKRSRLPDWRSDWVYKLIFEQAETAWKHCEINHDPDIWQYILIEEWSSSKDGVCKGTVLRLWVRDAKGLREVPVQSHAKHLSKIKARIFPFIIVEFHIYPDKSGVVVGQQEANTAGHGGSYLIHGGPEKAELVPDPSGGFWIS